MFIPINCRDVSEEESSSETDIYNSQQLTNLSENTKNAVFNHQDSELKSESAHALSPLPKTTMMRFQNSDANNSKFGCWDTRITCIVPTVFFLFTMAIGALQIVEKIS